MLFCTGYSSYMFLLLLTCILLYTNYAIKFVCKFLLQKKKMVPTCTTLIQSTSYLQNSKCLIIMNKPRGFINAYSKCKIYLSANVKICRNCKICIIPLPSRWSLSTDFLDYKSETLTLFRWRRSERNEL